MPYMHLDLPGTYSTAVKRDLATRLCKLYAEVMQTQSWRPNVGIAELGEDNLFRLGPDGLEQITMVLAKSRRGRPQDDRLTLGRKIVDICVDVLNVPRKTVMVEFTEHSGNEFAGRQLGRGVDSCRRLGATADCHRKRWVAEANNSERRGGLHALRRSSHTGRTVRRGRAKLAETLLVTMMNIEIGHPTDHAREIGWVWFHTLPGTSWAVGGRFDDTYIKGRKMGVLQKSNACGSLPKFGARD